MIGAWLLQHLVKETRASRSPLGVLAIHCGDQVVVRPTLLPLVTLFLLFRVARARGLGGLSLLFPLGGTVEENYTNYLFARGKVGGDVEKLASARGGLAPELMYQLLTGGAGNEGPDDVESVMLGSSVHCLENRLMKSWRDSSDFCRQLLRSQEFTGHTYVP
jgi:hypothetical protein